MKKLFFIAALFLCGTANAVTAELISCEPERTRDGYVLVGLYELPDGRRVTYFFSTMPHRFCPTHFEVNIQPR